MSNPHPLLFELTHKGKQDIEFAGHPPIMKVFYKYNYSFPTLVEGYLKKYNWENRRIQLTTIASLEQPDDDTIVYYRRLDTLLLPSYAWERVTINRKDQTMKCENISQNTDGSESLIDLYTFSNLSENKVQSELQAYQGFDKSFKIETYKNSIAKLIQAIKF